MIFTILLSTILIFTKMYHCLSLLYFLAFCYCILDARNQCCPLSREEDRTSTRLVPRNEKTHSEVWGAWAQRSFFLLLHICILLYGCAMWCFLFSFSGIDVGDQFYSRAEMVVLGIHSHWLNGIDYMGMKYQGKVLSKCFCKKLL